MTELLHDETGNRVEFVVRQLDTEVLVELGDRRCTADQKLALGLLADILIVLDVELVVDVADDLLDRIFDSHDARYAAVLVDHDRHVIAIAPEFLEEHVDALRLGHHHGRPHAFTDIEIREAPRSHVAQHVFGEQDADDIVAIVVYNGKPRMPRFDDHRQQLLRRIVTAHRHHLRSRNHNVAHLQIGDAKYAFHHLQCIRIDQAALKRLTHLLHEIFAVLRLARQGAAEFAHPAHGTVTRIGHADSVVSR